MTVTFITGVDWRRRTIRVHTIVVHGTNTIGDDRTYTYHLTVAR